MTHTARFRLSLLCASVFALTACQSIPKVKTDPVVAHPQISPTEAYNANDSQTISNANQPSIANQRWQDFYSDDRLKQLIATGLNNNKDVEAAMLAIQRARAQYQITDINDAAKIGSSAGASYGSTRGADATDSYNIGLAMSAYEFDFWGRVASLKQAALQSFLATTAAKDAVQISLISNIAQSYVSYSYNLAQLDLAKRTLATRLESQRINQLRFKAGLDSELSSVQAQAAVEQARVAISNAETALQKNRNALRFLVGSPIENSLLPPAAISRITNNTVLSAGLPSELLLYRPDIRQAEFNLKSAGANINVARAAFFPTISLAGNLGFASSDLTDLFKSGGFSWGIGPSVSLPIFDGGLRQANYDISEIAQQQALNTYEKSIQTAFREVNDVMATRQTLDDRLAAMSRMAQANQKNYQIANARNKAGLDNYLGVLDAQRSIFSTEQSILNLRQEQLNSQIQLYQALGGGVNLDVPVNPPSPQFENISDKVSRVAQRTEDTLQRTQTVIQPVAQP